MEKEIDNIEEKNAEELRVTGKAIELLSTVFDPEIPVNVYDLGLIYKIDYDVDNKVLHVDMTLTAQVARPPISSWRMCARSLSASKVRRKLISVSCSNRHGISP